MASTHGQKELRTDWPFTDGLIAGTTSQTGHEESLIAEESHISEKDKIGIG